MVDGQLIASVAIGPEYWQSNRLGELSLDGSVTGLHDYSAYDPVADCDGMCAGPDGHIYWIDVDPDANHYRMIDATPPGAPSYTVVGTHAMRRLNDGALIDGQLWSLDWENVQLVRLDQMDESLLGVKPVRIVPERSTSSRNQIPEPALSAVAQAPSGELPSSVSSWMICGSFEARCSISSDPIAWSIR